MQKLIKIILNNLHLIILGFSAYNVYQDYQVHQQKLEGVKSQIPTLEKKIKKAAQDIKEANKFQENLESAKKRVKEVAKQIEETQQQLPANTNDTVILETLKQEADKINIKDAFLRPGEEEKRDFYYAKEYIIEGRGTWLQMLIFLETLAKKDRIFNFNGLVMKRAQEKRKGRFQLVDLEATVEAYRYDPNYEEETGIEETEEGQGT